jgi:hypothetical protein
MSSENISGKQPPSARTDMIWTRDASAGDAQKNKMFTAAQSVGMTKPVPQWKV